MEPVRDAVVALGGNAIARFGDDGTVEARLRRATEAMRAVADLIEDGVRVVLTHGNGPVIGEIVSCAEAADGNVPTMPLFIAGADSEGGIGLMLQQALGNELAVRGLRATVATVVTQVVVDHGDMAFDNPTKPIGSYRDAAEARRLASELGWTMREEPGRGWRRCVASPSPKRIVELEAVTALRDAGIIPIAAGGGGVPVVERPDGTLAGVDAVIDKDWTGALLARDLGADSLVILMEQDALYEDFGTPQARPVPRLSAREARDLVAGLPAGSVGPKVAAASWFARHGGQAVMCRAEDLKDALHGRSGTWIEPDVEGGPDAP